MSSPGTVHLTHSEWDSAWKKAARILCVRLDGMGDVLMTTPAFAALREQREGRTLTLLTSPAGARLGRLLPDVKEIVTLKAPWMKHDCPAAAEGACDVINDLRQREFDAAVIFTVWSQSPHAAALLCYLAGIPLRLSHSRENPYGLLTHWLPDPDSAAAPRHEVRRQLDLVQSIGAIPQSEALRLSVPSALGKKVTQLIRTAGPYITVHPGATASSRRYAPELFARFIRRFRSTHPHSVIVAGDPTEVELCREIVKESRSDAISVAGTMTLSETVSLIARASLAVTNNSGPSHIAAATRTPLVCLYALTNLQHTPWTPDVRVLSHDVACKNCLKSVCPEGHHHCLRLVSPEQVLHACTELLSSREQRQLPELHEPSTTAKGDPTASTTACITARTKQEGAGV